MALQGTRRHGAEGPGFDVLRGPAGGGQRWMPRSVGDFDAVRMAKGLGWFSIALGSVEVLAPRVFSRALGARGTSLGQALTRFCGVREIAAGVGILSMPRSAGWMTSRVVGDVIDVALLVAAVASPYARRSRLLAAAAAVIPVMVLDAKCAQQLRGASGSRSAAARTRKRVTVNRPAEELYRAWREVSNLPRFMQQIESVGPIGERRSHWVARGPGGVRLEWDSEITDDRPGERIAWRSLPGAQIDTVGVVSFEPVPGGRGTQVTVEMEYTPPGGAMTAQLLKFIGQSPDQQLQEDLRRFKQLMETGEIIVARNQPAGAAQSPGEGRRGAASAARGALAMLKGGAR
jgi:uncharacterized membrane protein